MIRSQINTIDDARRALAALDHVLADSLRWARVSDGMISPYPMTNSTLQVMVPEYFEIGSPIRFSQAGNLLYGIVSAQGDHSISISAPALDVTKPLDSVWLGDPEMVVQMRIYVAGAFGNASPGAEITSLLGRQRHYWQGPPAYLVDYSARCLTDNGGGSANNPTLTPSIKTSAEALMSAVPTRATTALAHLTAGTLDPTAYRIVRDNAYGLILNAADIGAGTKAADLSVVLVFVLE